MRYTSKPELKIVAALGLITSGAISFFSPYGFKKGAEESNELETTLVQIDEIGGVGALSKEALFSLVSAEAKINDDFRSEFEKLEDAPIRSDEYQASLVNVVEQEATQDVRFANKILGILEAGAKVPIAHAENIAEEPLSK